MRIPTAKRVVGLLLAAGLVAGSSSVAGADEFSTDAPNPVTASTTVNVAVTAVPNEGPSDGGAGCNIGNDNDALTATARIQSDNPAVTVDQPEMTFETCGVPQPLRITVTPALCTPVSGTVTISLKNVDPNANAVKGVFTTETVTVTAAATNPQDPSCSGGPNPPSSTCSEPAAPAWAAALLKASNIKPKASSPNYVALVAEHMTQGAVFDNVPKSAQGPSTTDAYPAAVRSYMVNTLGLANLATLSSARLIRPGWDCTAAPPV